MRRELLIFVALLIGVVGLGPAVEALDEPLHRPVPRMGSAPSSNGSASPSAIALTAETAAQLLHLAELVETANRDLELIGNRCTALPMRRGGSLRDDGLSEMRE